MAVLWGTLAGAVEAGGGPADSPRQPQLTPQRVDGHGETQTALQQRELGPTHGHRRSRKSPAPHSVSQQHPETRQT